MIPDPIQPETPAPQDASRVETLRDAMLRQDMGMVRDELAALHPADAADTLRYFDHDERLTLLQALPTEPLSELLSYLDEGIRDEVLPELDTARLAAAVAELDTDDALQLIDAVDEDRQEELLAAVPLTDRIILEEGLTFPEDSAGRLMQREVMALPAHWTVGQAIDFFRDNERQSQEFYQIHLVDPRHCPVGTLSPSRLLSARRPEQLADLMDTSVHTFRAETDQEDVAFAFRKYGLISAGVVEPGGRLIGVITVDDIVEVIREEADADMLRLAGIHNVRDLSRASWSTARIRSWWLLVNLLTALLASYVISLFEGSIQQVVALAVLMPVVASMGGNAGLQTLTVIVRGMATRQITRTNYNRVLGKEAIVGVLNGMFFAIITGTVAGLWFHSFGIGVVMAAAMLMNLFVAALAGALIPLGLKRVGADPAVASSVFLTTVTDVVGFLAFLGLATLFLL